MPNYNHGLFLPEAIEAVLNQSRPPDEFIIIDDGSTDNSVDIIKEYASKAPVIQFDIHKKNMGPLYTANRLFELVSSDYVYGAAADDKILPGFLQKSMEQLARCPQAGLCSTLTRKMDEQGKDMGLLRIPIVSSKAGFINPEKSSRFFSNGRGWIQGNTTIYNRRLLIKEGGFNPELYSYTDGFVQMVLSVKYGACFIPEPLTCWRILGSGYSSKTRKDIRFWKKIIDRAETIMREKYKALFSESFIHKWKKHQYLQICLSLINHPAGRKLGPELSSDLQKMAAIKTSRLDRINKYMYFSVGLKELILKVYFTYQILGLWQSFQKFIDKINDSCFVIKIKHPTRNNE